MHLNILVIGAGAIGCLVGGKLAQVNQKVTLVGRAGFVEQVRARGLLLTDEQGAHTVRAIRPVASIDEAYARAETAFDLAILTVKSYDTAAAVTEIQQTLGATGAPAAPILSLQNGVGNEEAIAAALPAAPVIAGSITTPVSVEGPGAVRVDKPRYGLGLASWRPPTGSIAYQETVALMRLAGFTVTEFANAASMKWTKLLMNMLGNATSAILDEPPQQVFADRRMVDLEIAAWREALTVMDKTGVPVANLDKYPLATLAPLIRRAPNFALRPVLVQQIGGARGGKLPSLHIDLHSGKAKNEVGWLNGAVADAGQRAGVATPVNQALTDIVTQLAAHPEEQASWKGSHQRLLEMAGLAGG